MEYPYNDEYMTYDKTLGFYVLTPKACDEYLGEELSYYFDGNELKQKAFIREISEDIREFINSYTYVSSIKYKRYLMAKSPNLRPVIMQALKYQLRYAFRSSANALKDMHGVHIEKGKVIDLSKIRGKVGIAQNAIRVLENEGLLYVGKNLYVPNIEEDGTW